MLKFVELIFPPFHKCLNWKFFSLFFSFLLFLFNKTTNMPVSCHCGVQQTTLIQLNTTCLQDIHFSPSPLDGLNIIKYLQEFQSFALSLRVDPTCVRSPRAEGKCVQRQLSRATSRLNVLIIIIKWLPEFYFYRRSFLALARSAML